MEAAGVPRLDVERGDLNPPGPPLNAGHWSAWAIAPGQQRAPVFGPAYAVAVAEERSMRGSSFVAPWGPQSPNCMLETLAY